MTSRAIGELWVPAARLVPILDRYRGTTDHLSQRTARKMRLLRTGEQAFVGLGVVDEILVELDLVEWLMVPAELGGLGDIYFDGAQYGKPGQRIRRRHATAADRLEARKASWRLNDRIRGEKVTISCPECGGDRVVGADYAKRLMKPGARCKGCAGRETHRIWAEAKAA